MVYNKIGCSLIRLLKFNSKQELTVPKNTNISIVINKDLVFTVSDFADFDDNTIEDMAKVVYCMFGSVLFPSAFKSVVEELTANNKIESVDKFKAKLSDLMKGIERGDDYAVYDDLKDGEEPFVNPQNAI